MGICQSKKDVKKVVESQSQMNDSLDDSQGQMIIPGVNESKGNVLALTIIEANLNVPKKDSGENRNISLVALCGRQTSSTPEREIGGNKEVFNCYWDYTMEFNMLEKGNTVIYMGLMDSQPIANLLIESCWELEIPPSLPLDTPTQGTLKSKWGNVVISLECKAQGNGSGHNGQAKKPFHEASERCRLAGNKLVNCARTRRTSFDNFTKETVDESDIAIVHDNATL